MVKNHDLLIAKDVFHRIIRGVTQAIVKESELKYQVAALQTLQEATENLIICFFEKANHCTLQDNRTVLTAQDINTAWKLHQTESSDQQSVNQKLDKNDVHNSNNGFPARTRR